ncbi:hypothetical protein ES708_30826 [subsurface metagenome]
MAKPKKPLLSLAARGTIADSLTFQKRGRRTIAREKPIPKDPRSEAQLAQRDRYKEAVASWHSLTLEEKEAWRGVCPGLTAYQCFMRAELLKVAPPPPPEEKTEEQTQYNTSMDLYTGFMRRGGQRLTISNRKVTKLGFWLARGGSPTGDVTFEIRRVSDDSLISSQVWGDAADLLTAPTYEEVEFADPQIINEEVRICAHYWGGTASNYVVLWLQSTNVKPAELYTYMPNLTWSDLAYMDCAYRYKYYLP